MFPKNIRFLPRIVCALAKRTNNNSNWFRCLLEPNSAVCTVEPRESKRKNGKATTRLTRRIYVKFPLCKLWTMWVAECWSRQKLKIKSKSFKLSCSGSTEEINMRRRAKASNSPIYVFHGGVVGHWNQIRLMCNAYTILNTTAPMGSQPLLARR